MGATGGAVLDHGKAPLAPLHDHGQVTTSPAQGGGAVGLLTIEGAQRQHLAAETVLQQNAAATVALHQAGKEPAIAAEGRLLPSLSSKAG
jgi:hypothetical protein